MDSPGGTMEGTYPRKVFFEKDDESIYSDDTSTAYSSYVMISQPILSSSSDSFLDEKQSKRRISFYKSPRSDRPHRISFHTPIRHSFHKNTKMVAHPKAGVSPKRLSSVLDVNIIRHDMTDCLSRLVPVSSEEIKGKERLFSTHYTIEKKLGEGAYGEVWLAIDRHTGFFRAVKIIEKKVCAEGYELRHDNMTREVKVLRILDHPNILRVLDFFEDRRHFYIVTDYVPGGELFEELLTKKKIEIAIVADYLRQILRGLSYIHEKGIVHRDLKLENILLDTRAKRSNGLPTLQIIDFGLSYSIKNEGLMNHKVGTYQYMAPEVIERNNPDSSCDIWSVGIMFFMMVCGYPPFYSRRGEDKLLAKICTGEMNKKSMGYRKLKKDELAKNLLKKMLLKEAAFRPPAKDLLQDPFFRFHASAFALKIDRVQLVSVMDNLAQYEKHHLLKHFRLMILYYIGCKLTTPQETITSRVIFELVDICNRGLLGPAEISEAILQIQETANLQMDPNNDSHYQALKTARLKDDCHAGKDIANRFLMRCDFDNDGLMEYSEFITVSSNAKALMSDERLAIAWCQILWVDSTEEEIRFAHFDRVLGGDPSENKSVFDEMDEDNDGVIRFSNFKSLMRNSRPSDPSKMQHRDWLLSHTEE